MVEDPENTENILFIHCGTGFDCFRQLRGKSLKKNLPQVHCKSVQVPLSFLTCKERRYLVNNYYREIIQNYKPFSI
jgi:hypothetical protein